MPSLLLHEVLYTQSFLKDGKLLRCFGAIQTFMALALGTRRHIILLQQLAVLTSWDSLPPAPPSKVSVCEIRPKPLLITLVSSGPTIIPWHMVTVLWVWVAGQIVK